MADDDGSTDGITNPVTLFTFTPELAHEALPGGGEHDPELVDDLVRALNRIYTLTGLALIRALAECVIDRLAGGDAEAFRLGYRKHVSFAALCKREDLSVGPDELSRAVHIYYQLRAMPPLIGEALSPTHHRSLLAVQTPEKRLEYAKQVYTRKLSTRQLDEVIAEDRDKDAPARRGPKPKSPTRKLRDTVDKLTADVQKTDVTDADPDEAEALVESLRALAQATRVLHAAAKKRFVLAED